MKSFIIFTEPKPTAMPNHIYQDQINVPVQDNSPYFLSVVIGNGQLGSTTFQNLNGQLFSPNVKNESIGIGANIKGRSSNVVSVVMDVNPNTNDMVVSYYVTTQTVDDLSTIAPTHVAPFSAMQSDTITFILQLKFI